MDSYISPGSGSGSGSGFGSGSGSEAVRTKRRLWGGAERFKADMDVYLRALKDTQPSPGQPRVIYAGMEEVEMSAERHEEGIPYHPEVIGW